MALLTTFFGPAYKPLFSELLYNPQKPNYFRICWFGDFLKMAKSQKYYIYCFSGIYLTDQRKQTFSGSVVLDTFLENGAYIQRECLLGKSSPNLLPQKSGNEHFAYCSLLRFGSRCRPWVKSYQKSNCTYILSTFYDKQKSNYGLTPNSDSKATKSRPKFTKQIQQ